MKFEYSDWFLKSFGYLFAIRWNNKWQKNKVQYKIKDKTIVSIPEFLHKNTEDYLVIQTCKNEKFDIFYEKIEERMYAIEQWVKSKIKYVQDKKAWNQAEYWQTSGETLLKYTGDCVANYEEIYTPHGVKQVGELKEGDLVLSYDFKEQQYVQKRIIKIWEKGKLSIKRVHLRNGQYIDITDNHPLWVRINQSGESKYEKTYLKDIDLTRWWKRKLPVAKHIPYEVKDIDWLNEDLCFVLGHFLAEGFIAKDKNHIETSGYDAIEEIIPLLEKNNILFKERKNNTGVPIIIFQDDKWKDFLRKFKGEDTLSFSAHLPEEIFHLPSSKLQKILDGYFLGDGHYIQKEWHSATNAKFVYSTSSEQLAKDIQRIGLQLETPFYTWKQEHHGGAGKRPIYRITYNPESTFAKDHGYKGISEVSISYIEELGYTKMRDFEVEDTHTFIFRNGLISHQCEDGSILIYSLAIMSGIPAWRMKLCAGNVKNPKTGKIGGHAYIIFLRNDMTWCVCDWSYYPTKQSINKRLQHKEIEYYNQIWWTANSEQSWAQHDVKLNFEGLK